MKFKIKNQKYFYSIVEGAHRSRVLNNLTAVDAFEAQIKYDQEEFIDINYSTEGSAQFEVVEIQGREFILSFIGTAS